MRKILGILVLVVTFMVPTQIIFSPPHMVLAEVYGDEAPTPDTYQMVGRIRVLEMKMQKLEHMMMGKKMSKAQMKKVMKMLRRIEIEIENIGNVAAE